MFWSGSGETGNPDTDFILVTAFTVCVTPAACTVRDPILVGAFALRALRLALFGKLSSQNRDCETKLRQIRQVSGLAT